MENNSTNTPTREFVWKINKAPKMKSKTATTDQKNIRELVEKQFQNMSMVLFDKINTLENEIKTIKNRNTQLEQQISNATLQDTNQSIYDPWYL
ncbi:hypothetical protein [Microscilla marina]|uniref:Uncharacterized protein n=1 Tax=Microscilla marina ATCC 23134 TaxID=313606 RepID=A1ZP14_MICM2|nr:hypothetical protein [Microscilla marina]EAY27806.1 hypothetical protein M23134_00247 [Microscilla marina ATCC 23134]